jgi:hypothetical protein
MKSILFLVACALLPSLAESKQTVHYRIAHTRQQDVNMVMVVTSPSFFSSGGNEQSRGYTALQSCVRGANLAGEVVLVADVNRRFMFYGPKRWDGYLRTLDMQWVNARLNKSLTCNF